MDSNENVHEMYFHSIAWKYITWKYIPCQAIALTFSCLELLVSGLRFKISQNKLQLAYNWKFWEPAHDSDKKAGQKRGLGRSAATTWGKPLIEIELVGGYHSVMKTLYAPVFRCEAKQTFASTVPPILALFSPSRADLFSDASTPCIRMV
jgi:hypothetical protein